MEMNELIEAYRTILNRKAVIGQNFIITNGIHCFTLNSNKMLEQELTNFPTQFDNKTANKICEDLNKLNETKCYIVSYRDFYKEKLEALERLSK